MNALLKSLLSNKGAVGLYRKLLEHYYKVASDHFDCSVGDILLRRDTIQANQFLLTSRLLDVEAYIDGSDKSFPYQNAISYKAYGSAHDEQLGNKKFQSLIESYLKEGYRAGSYVTCDRNMNLMDGNHRMGLHVYEGIETISVRRVKRSIPFQYGIDGYYESGLPDDFIEKVLNRYNHIQEWLLNEGITFNAYFKGNNSKTLCHSMYNLCNVLKVISLDKESWMALFSMPNPNYIVQDGELVSQRAVEIERILRVRADQEVVIKISKNCKEGRSLYKKYKR